MLFLTQEVVPLLCVLHVVSCTGVSAAGTGVTAAGEGSANRAVQPAHGVKCIAATAAQLVSPIVSVRWFITQLQSLGSSKAEQGFQRHMGGEGRGESHPLQAV